jgi:hypothetical protein
MAWTVPAAMWSELTNNSKKCLKLNIFGPDSDINDYLSVTLGGKFYYIRTTQYEAQKNCSFDRILHEALRNLDAN